MKTFGSFHFRVNGFVERSNKTGNKQEVPCVVSLVKLIILLSMLCKNRIYAFKKKKKDRISFTECLGFTKAKPKTHLKAKCILALLFHRRFSLIPTSSLYQLATRFLFVDLILYQSL